MSIKTEFLKKLGFGSHSEQETSEGAQPIPEPASSPEPPDHSEDATSPEQSQSPPNRLRSKPETSPPLPHIESAGRRLTGKVAQLPRTVRTQVNQMLDDGVTYKKICAFLEKLGYPGFVHQNIQRWKENGYQRWVRRQEELEEDRIETEYAQELVEDPKAAAHVAESNEMKLALKTSRLLDHVRKWTPDEILCGAKAKVFFQLSRSVTLQLTQRTKRELAKSEIAFRDRKNEISEEAKQKIRDLTDPLTKEQRDAILDKIDELLGIRIDFGSDATAAPIPATPEACAGQGEGRIPEPSDPDSDAQPPEAMSPSTPEYTVEVQWPPCNEAEVRETATSQPETRNSEHETSPAAPSTLEYTVESSSPSEPSESSEQSVVTSPLSPSLSTLPPVKSPPPVLNDASANADNITLSQKASSFLNRLRAKTETPSETSQLAPLPPVKSPSSVLTDGIPISPLAPKPPAKKQPRNHVPVFDRYGALIEWLPREGPGSEPKFENSAGWNNRRGQTLCWLNPKNPCAGEPPTHWKLAILDSDGRVIGLTPHHITPSETAVPLRAKAYINYTIAWHEETLKRDPNADRVGALVG
jgi:hypothetical protein